MSRLIDDEQSANSNDTDDFGWEKYYNLEAIYKWLDHLLEKYPNQLTNYSYGTSYEGRALRAVKVSHKKVRTANVNFCINFQTKIPSFHWISGKSNHFHRINNPCT